ncbi:MAG TPA: thioredoxin family protein [Caldisericia bacterium]|nr:thioredoxin family protein [Caldisericia bacterium]HPF48962.1 thioredoxin family protein [Caldisericia bacterium]HPI83174.1 thioredoxin family protein [Caldisericia bacterium]HPQ92401.1 thioredoxin family protein [Caldisericia bacterium]HRV74501.1 thioredoxin family protein [Caldisericia bacterium]
MKIEVLGTGCCKKCGQMYDNTVRAMEQMGLDAQIEKIDDINKIISMGVMTTPGLAIDGTVVSSGRALTIDEIIEHIKNAQA